MRLPLVCLLLSLASCTIWKKEKRAAELRGPIEATVAKVERKKLGIDAIGGGHVGILVPAVENTSTCELQITKPKKLTLRVQNPCDNGYQLASDPEGSRLAHAPLGGDWSIVHFGKSGRSFDGLAHPTVGALDWSKVPRLEDEYVDQLRALIAQEKQPTFKAVSDALLDEIVESKGEAELARVLEEVSGAPADADYSAFRMAKKSIFARGLERLHGDARQRVLATLEKSLEKLAQKDDGANLRAALYVDLDLGGQKFLPGLDAAIAERDAAAWTPEMQFIAAMILARKPSGPVACKLLTRIAKQGEALDLFRDDLRVALATIARHSDACPALEAIDKAYARLRQGAWCTERSWFCPYGEKPQRICSTDEARARLDAFFKRPLAEARKLDLDVHEAYVAAMLARKVDAKRQKQLARQLYQHDVKSDAPNCSAVDGGAAHCAPNEDALDSAMMCTLETTAKDNGITVHFDDAKKRYWFTKP